MDADGFVRITGRKKDIIIRKGENLSAKAIEDELYEHPSVADVAVIGVPDAECGERVCACVVLAKDADAADPRPRSASSCVARGLMKQKIPEQLEIIDALPRTATGKVTQVRAPEALQGLPARSRRLTSSGRLLLVRHGSSAATSSAAFSPNPHIELTERGIEQARRRRTPYRRGPRARPDRLEPLSAGAPDGAVHRRPGEVHRDDSRTERDLRER